MSSALSLIEPLESRIAPASLVFTDFDGEEVTLTVNKGTDEQLASAVTMIAGGEGMVFQKLDLTLPIYRGANVTFAITGGTVGDGQVQVGAIDASGLDLGKVIVPGELGQIDAGDAKFSTPGLKLLQVDALGGTVSSQPEASASSFSVIKGPLTKVEIAGDVAGSLAVNGASSSGITSLFVGGKLLGAGGQDSGSITVQGSIGTVKIDGDFQGDGGAGSGSLNVSGSIGTATLGGSLRGGLGEESGSLVVGATIGNLSVSGSVVGSNLTGAATHNGVILANKITKATIGGRLEGGVAPLSGLIDANGLLQSITVTGGLQGGVGRDGGSITGGRLGKVIIGSAASPDVTALQGGVGMYSGSILSGTSVDRVEIFGLMQGGPGELSGSISTVGTISDVLLHGDLQGGSGQASGNIGSAVLVKKVVIEGDLEGGNGPLSGRVVSIGAMGSVTVKGNLIGGDNLESGSIGAPAGISSVLIEGNIEGGGEFHSGAVLTTGTLGKLVVKGNIIGGAGTSSGYVEADNLTFLEVGEDVEGGAGQVSGSIVVNGRAKSIVIKGSVVGSSSYEARDAFNNGSIFGDGVFDLIQVNGDVQGGTAFGSGSIISYGTLKKVVVNGSLRGSTGNSSGIITTLGSGEAILPSQAQAGPEPGSIGSVIIRGAIFGGDGSSSGSIESFGYLASVLVEGTAEVPNGEGPILTGSVFGGLGPYSATIYGRFGIGAVTIARDLAGSESATAAKIYTFGGINKVTIGGSMQGSSGTDNSGFFPGQIAANGLISAVSVGGSIQGSAGDFSAAIVGGSLGSIKVTADIVTGGGFRSAALLANSGSIATISVTGAMRPANGESASPYIYAFQKIGSITAESIRGQQIFSNGILTPVPAVIMARGILDPANVQEAVAIDSVRVTQFMAYTQILAGHDAGGLVNYSARINKVEVGTKNKPSDGDDWVSNDVIAGFSAGDDSVFGTDDDNVRGLSGQIHSRIAIIIINGTAEDFETSHAIEALEVVAVTVNGVKLRLNNGTTNDTQSVIVTGLTTVVNETENQVIGGIGA